MSADSAALVKKLNTTCHNALQAAAGLCVSKTNHSIEIEHWLLGLLDQGDSDVPRILRRFEVEEARLRRDATVALERLKTGNNRIPAMSSLIFEWIKEAWVFSSVQLESAKIRSGALIHALVDDERLSRVAREISREFEKIKPDELRASFGATVKGSPEDDAPSLAEGPAGAGGGAAAPAGSKTPALDQYTIDMTARALEGKIDPVVGREREVGQMVDILVRRRQNNPILTGEAGVGKTAVVEGFAARVAEGDVPPQLRGTRVLALDLGLLQAGAGVKGEFENRLKQVLNEVKSSARPIIMFIDEAHTMIGAGGQAGQNDAANLLKPALARGELRTIAATTWAEYKKYFEKDPALARRFQVVKVEEPEEAKAVRMMRGVAAVLEKHHGVRVLEEAVEAAVKLSARYITGRQLPDKCLSLLDTACARVRISQTAMPPALEDLIKEARDLDVEIEILNRELAAGAPHRKRLAEAVERRAEVEARRAALAERHAAELAAVEEIKALLDKVDAARAANEAASNGKPNANPDPAPTPAVGDAPAPAPADAEALRAELAERTAALRALQGETPLVRPFVDFGVVAEVVAGWTGVPLGKMRADEIHNLLNLKSRLEERIVGQSHALEGIARRLLSSRANLTDPRRPIGVFLLVGPSGVGKTETALALADSFYGGEASLVTINMSEYKEAHTVSSLKGSPPGYVGYGEGGVLTEAVRRKPYCVLLLDEIEKAHPDVSELFYQVFDKGVLEDGEGREIDFKNTLIILTSNVGSDLIVGQCADPDTRPDPEALADLLRAELEKVFKPAFLGRMVTIPYYPISDEVLGGIVKLQLDRIAARLRDNHGAELVYGPELVRHIAGRCLEVSSGARRIDQLLTRTILPEVSREILNRMAEGKGIARVEVSVAPDGGFAYAVR